MEQQLTVQYSMRHSLRVRCQSHKQTNQIYLRIKSNCQTIFCFQIPIRFSFSGAEILSNETNEHKAEIQNRCLYLNPCDSFMNKKK